MLTNPTFFLMLETGIITAKTSLHPRVHLLENRLNLGKPKICRPSGQIPSQLSCDLLNAPAACPFRQFPDMALESLQGFAADAPVKPPTPSLFSGLNSPTVVSPEAVIADRLAVCLASFHEAHRPVPS
jgi:hypothetical protein